MQKVIILGIEVADIGREDALEIILDSIAPQDAGLQNDNQHYITTPNPEIVLAAAKDKELRSIINHSDLSLADGFGLKIGAWVLGQKLEHRIAGADFMLDVCGLAEKEGWPVFLLGGMESHRTTPAPPWKGGDSVADRAGERLRKLYPNIQIIGAESGGKIFYKGSLAEFTPSEAGGMETTGEWVASDENIIDKINQSGAKILFVGFGCPKQEKWLRDNLNKLTTVRMAMTVGGTFDYLAGRARRAPLILRRLGLEWVWRLVHEPRRAGRIWNATAHFLWKIFICRMRIAFVYRHNVVGFITNDHNEVLLVQRANEKHEHWQLPQGGVDKGESEEQAVLREMREEVGTDNLRILGKHPRKYAYKWPHWHQRKGQYRGQRQTIFYLRHRKENQDIKIDENEIKDYQWVPIDGVLSIIHHYRQPMTKMAVEGFTMSFPRKRESRF